MAPTFTDKKKSDPKTSELDEALKGVNSRAAAASTAPTTKEHIRLSEPAKTFVNNSSNSKVLQDALKNNDQKRWKAELDKLFGRPKLQEELMEYYKSVHPRYVEKREELMQQWVEDETQKREKTGMSRKDAYTSVVKDAMAAGFSLSSIAKAGQNLGFSNSFISNTLQESASVLGLDQFNAIVDLMRNLGQITEFGKERGTASREASEQAEEAASEKEERGAGEDQSSGEGEKEEDKKKDRLKKLGRPKHTQD